MFYGPSNAAHTSVKHWWLIDLKAFRAGLIRHVGNGHNVVMGDQANSDGTCFKWFDIRSFPAQPPLVVAASADKIAADLVNVTTPLLLNDT